MNVQNSVVVAVQKTGNNRFGKFGPKYQNCWYELKLGA